MTSAHVMTSGHVTLISHHQSPEQQGGGHSVQAGAPNEEDGRQTQADGDQGRPQVNLTVVSVAWRVGH